jgi:hypothetical protein
VRLIPLVILATLAACTSCAHYADFRSPAQQYNTMVRITTECLAKNYVASGVLVSDHEVLTANHVTQCELIPDSGIYVPASRLVVWVTDAEASEATVEINVPQADLARLHTKDSFGDYFSGISVGAPPEIGDKVCEVSAEPRPTYRCGVTQASRPGRVAVDFMVEHGNSGSGMYNSRGALVGITTNQFVCENHQICAGFGTALAGYAWLVP